MIVDLPDSPAPAVVSIQTSVQLIALTKQKYLYGALLLFLVIAQLTVYLCILLCGIALALVDFRGAAAHGWGFVGEWKETFVGARLLEL